MIDPNSFCRACVKSITSSSDNSTVWQSARKVPKVGRRRPSQDITEGVLVDMGLLRQIATA